MAETTENRVKIGAQVDESVYAEFKQFVYELTGQKRGVLGEAVEAALREYMESDDGDIEGDVSNADLMREIRALQHSDETPAPPPGSDKRTLDDDSSDDDGESVESHPSSTDETPAPPPGRNKGTLDDDSVDDDGSSSGKPPLNAPPGERVDWLASSINIQGPVSFGALVDVVNEQYPKLSEPKCRDLAWGWAAVAKPGTEDYPDDLNRNLSEGISTDSELRARVDSEDRPQLHFYPRSHSSGAWFKIEKKYSDNLLNHQDPTERGEIVVYIGQAGAVALGKEFGWLESGSEFESEFEAKWGDRDKSSLPAFMRDDDESTDSDDEGESIEDGSEDVDIAGATDGDSTFAEMEDADRGRD